MRPDYECMHPDEVREAAIRLDDLVASWAAALDSGSDAQEEALALRLGAGYPGKVPPGKCVPVPCVGSWGVHLEEMPADVLRPVYLNLIYNHRSANQVLRSHWRARQRERQAIAAQVATQTKSQSNLPGSRLRPIPRRVHYLVYRRTKMKDFDNFVMGLKDVQDVIEGAGLIWEDSMEWIVPSYAQDNAKGAVPRVEVTIWDIPEVTWTDEQRRVVEGAGKYGAGERKTRSQIKAMQTLRRNAIASNREPKIVRKRGRLSGGKNKAK